MANPKLWALPILNRSSRRTTELVMITLGYRSHSSTPVKEIDMVDLIKKALYTGVGLAVLTKEKAEELVKDLTQQAKLSEQEGKELFEGLLKQSEQARNDFQAKIDEAVLTVVKRLNLATKDEVAALTAKVDALASKVGQQPGT
jgi:polyhydroxyalkanoate synthesis regulator phasin